MCQGSTVVVVVKPLDGQSRKVNEVTNGSALDGLNPTWRLRPWTSIARLRFLEGRSERVVFELGLVDHRERARLSDGGAAPEGVRETFEVRTGTDGRGKRALPRLPGNEACQPDDERQGRKPDG